MKYPTFFGRVHECMSVLFMVAAIDEPQPEAGDLVQTMPTNIESDAWEWFVVLERVEDEHVEYYVVRRASWLDRLFGWRGGKVSVH